MGKRRESYNGTLLLYNCKTISTELGNNPTLIDYILDDYQFSDKMAEYYKGYHLNPAIAAQNRGIIYDPDNLRSAITVAIIPCTLQNVNTLSRELAVMRSSESTHLLRYDKFSHIGSFFIVEYPFLIRLCDLIEMVKKERLDHRRTGCIPERTLVKIVYGILNGLSELHQLKMWHSKLDSKSVCISVHDAKIVVSNYTHVKPSKCKGDEDGPLETYMAPEQAARFKRNTSNKLDYSFASSFVTRVTEKVDVWAVGMLIYEMAIGKPLYKHDFEGSCKFPKFVDKIMEMPLPKLVDLFPFQYAPLIDKLLSSCIQRDVLRRPCASELLAKFKYLFKTFCSDENVILEAIDDSRTILASFLPNRMEKFACAAADQPVNAKLSIPLKQINPRDRLKWKRFNKNKIHYNKLYSLSMGDSNLTVKVRKESKFFSRLNPFIYVQTTIPPYCTRAVSYLQEAIFQLVTKKVMTKFQGLLVCAIISQLTEFNILDEENVAQEFVVIDTYDIDEDTCMQKIHVPIEPMTTHEIICDSKTLYQSVLLEYVFPKKHY